MTDQSYVFDSDSLVESDRIGRTLARAIPDRCVIALCGTLGAGKTRFVQAMATEYGIDPSSVTSPTYVLCHEYHGDRSLFHFDAYRIKSELEFEQLGPDEYYSGPGVTVIEWADRVVSCLPKSRVLVEIEIVSDVQRRFTLQAIGSQFAPHIEAAADWLRASM